MATFKMLHGDESNISLDITPFHEGWAYITTSGYYYVDLNIGTVESPNNQRIKLNANNAEMLAGMSLDEIRESIREIAREEALKIETAAMEFMGTVTSFPTGLTANDKGHMYKVAKEFTVNNNISIPIYQEVSTYDTNPVEIAIPAEYYESIPESGKLYIDYQTLFDGNVQGNYKVSVILDLDYFGEMSSTITVENGASYELGYGNVVTGARVVLEDQDSTGEENSTYGVTLNINSVIFAQTVPVEMQGQTIRVGDTIIWDGYAWYVIPSGDDTLDTTELKEEIIAEMEDYVDNAILNGAW